MKRAKYFPVHELVPPAYYQKYGDYAHRYLDDRLLIVLDALRKRYGPITVNNYQYGGDRTESGLRIPGQDYYRPTSQHSHGRAADGLLKNLTAEEVRNDLQDFGLSILHLPAGVDSITIENKVSWLHVDVRNNNPGVNFFDP